MKVVRLLLAMVLALPAAGAACAAAGDVPAGVKVPAWNELSAQQRTDLARFAGQWDQLPASRRVHILERYESWQSLPNERRETMREGVQNFQQMSPEQRQRMRRSLQAVRALPPMQQRVLRERWQSLSPRQRRAWLEVGGPGIAPEPQQ